MHGTGQTTKSMPDYREPQADEKRQKVFCDITWEHPAEKIITNFSKPGRSLHVTEEAVNFDSVKWLYFYTANKEVPRLVYSRLCSF